MAWDLGDYKEVSERVAELFAKHPEASMRGTYEFVTIGEQTGVVYRAECFRTPDDPAPGVGTAWEDMPGKSTYTKGSELQNAETSAWGRAIVAAGASTSKKIASANEMRSASSRAGESRADAGTAGSAPAPPAVPDVVSVPPIPPGPVTSKLRRENIKARCIALQGDHVSVADKRAEWQLPTVDKSDEKQLVMWEQMLTDLESAL
jgi:hypothetical protein